MTREGTLGPEVGDELVLDVGPVAHGGHCVARHEGQVLFVRHALPGERVRATVTEIGSGGRYLRADAVEVLRAAPGRVPPPCPWAGPGACGGCDWQHASLTTQRELKAAVVAEQLQRLAGLGAEDLPGPVVCEPVPGDEDGLRWRTRVEVAVGPDRVPGLRVHRSHEILPVEDCLIAHPGVTATGVLGRPVPDGVDAVDLVAPSVGAAVAVPLARPEPPRTRGRRRPTRPQRRTPVPVGGVPEVTEQVGEHAFTLSARGFWQVHPGAAATFTDQVLAWLDPQPGEHVLDLYSGVGLFAVPLAERVGPQGAVLAVEADRAATEAAVRHLAPWPWAEAVAEPTEQALARLLAAGERADLVVLDPPRSGAGRAVVGQVVELGPRAIAYVACDPAALARDLATFRDRGLELTGLRVLDAFPMTHHVETLALLTRPSGRG